jgi:hypothetical protein
MAEVTIERIAAVQADLAKAIVQTSERSTLSEREQDQLLEQGCAQACDLLTDWLASEWWHAIRPSNGTPLGQLVPDRKRFEEFLGPTLKDVLSRASRSGVTVPPGYVDKARKALEATAGRHPKMTAAQLRQEVAGNVGTLKTDVCRLTDRLHHLGSTQQHRATRWQHARKALTTVWALVPAVVIGMAGVAPGQAARNLREWDRQLISVMALDSVADSMAIPSIVGTNSAHSLQVAHIQQVALIEKQAGARGSVPRASKSSTARERSGVAAAIVAAVAGIVAAVILAIVSPVAAVYGIVAAVILAIVQRLRRVLSGGRAVPARTARPPGRVRRS